jgi:hypothetical protein
MGESLCIYIKKKDISKIFIWNLYHILNKFSGMRWSRFNDKYNNEDNYSEIRAEDLLKKQIGKKLNQQDLDLLKYFQELDVVFCGDYNDKVMDKLEEEGYLDLEDFISDIIQKEQEKLNLKSSQ